MTERNATPTEDSFDVLTKALARATVSRRRGLHTLGAGIVAAALGTLAISGDVDAKKKKNRNRNRRKKNNNNNNDNNQAPPPPPPPPPAGGDASDNCRDDNDQCGSNANDQGSCRLAAAADNQGGFICSSDQSTGVTCQASNQCGAGTRCVEVGVGNECRVVIN